MTNKKQVILSEGIRDVLGKLPLRIRSLESKLTTTLVNLYGEMPPEGSVGFAAIRIVKYKSEKGLQLLLRRYDPTNTTTKLRPAQIRKTTQGTWVTARSEEEAIDILVAHFNDMKNRVATGARYGIKVLDNRRYNRQGI